MNVQAQFLIACVLATFQASDTTGTISGIALNGTANGTPLADAAVVLRASQDGEFFPIAETTTDVNGRFEFTGLPIDPQVLYLPGVNRDGVHYPGPRVQLQPQHVAVQLKLIAYDAIDSPAPLVNRRHEITVRPAAEFIEVEETLVVENPSLTTYVGESTDTTEPVTLRLSLPDGLDNITFEREFHGRNFQLQDGILTTNIPFRPGTQELKFTYRLPAGKSRIFVRNLDRPTYDAVVRVLTSDTRRIACNLPDRTEQAQGEITFAHRNQDHPLAANYAIELQLDSLPIGFGVYARWTAGGLLALLIVGSVHVIRSVESNGKGKTKQAKCKSRAA